MPTFWDLLPASLWPTQPFIPPVNPGQGSDWPPGPPGPSESAASMPDYLAPDTMASLGLSGAPGGSFPGPSLGTHPDPNIADDDRYRRMLADAKRASDFVNWVFGPPSGPPRAGNTATMQAVATPSSGGASYPNMPTYEAPVGRAENAEAKTDSSARPATPFVDRWAESSDFRSRPLLYSRPIPTDPPAFANMPALTRSHRPNAFAYPHFPVGLSDDLGTNGRGWLAQNSSDPSLFDQSPRGLREAMAVPPSPHPAQALKERPGLDINDLVDRIIFAESGGNTYAAPDSGNRFFRNGSVIGKGPRGFGSSALGAGQFIASSWVDEIKHHQPELVRENPWLHPSIRQRPDKLTVKDADETGLLNSRTDYALARHGTAHLAEQNAARLIDAQLPVTARNLYLAHFLGAKDAINVLNAAPNTPAEQVVSPAAARANASVVNGTDVQRLLALIDNKMASARPSQLPFR